MPPEELEVFRKLESAGDNRIEAVTDAVFQGIRTSANKIYVVDVLDADRIESADQGETVTIVPTGESEQYEVETDLLRPFFKGADIERWRSDWSGLHVIYPYHVEENDSGELSSRLYSEDELQQRVPLTWDYFRKHEKKLRDREKGKWEDSDEWHWLSP